MRARGWLVVAIALSLAGTAACSPRRAAATIEVDKPVALADTPVHVRVSGLAAGEEVTISAQDRDGGGRVWRSQAQVTADGGGVVDLDRARPRSGTYQGVDGMGLFWSMNPPDGDPDQTVNSESDQATYFPPEGASFTVDLTVAVGDPQLATHSLTRQWLGDGVTVRALRTDTDQVAGVLALPPAGSTPRVAVLAIGGRCRHGPGGGAARLPRRSRARRRLLPLPRPSRPVAGHPAGVLRDCRAAPGHRVRRAAWARGHPGLLARHRAGDAGRRLLPRADRRGRGVRTHLDGRGRVPQRRRRLDQGRQAHRCGQPHPGRAPGRSDPAAGRRRRQALAVGPLRPGADRPP